MARTDAERRAKCRYIKKCKQINLTIYPSEPDILAKLESEKAKKGGSYAGYIKSLIYQDIERNG